MTYRKNTAKEMQFDCKSIAHGQESAFLET
jgi:hypothetical protein